MSSDAATDSVIENIVQRTKRRRAAAQLDYTAKSRDLALEDVRNASRLGSLPSRIVTRWLVETETPSESGNEEQDDKGDPPGNDISADDGAANTGDENRNMRIHWWPAQVDLYSPLTRIRDIEGYMDKLKDVVSKAVFVTKEDIDGLKDAYVCVMEYDSNCCVDDGEGSTVDENNDGDGGDTSDDTDDDDALKERCLAVFLSDSTFLHLGPAPSENDPLDKPLEAGKGAWLVLQWATEGSDTDRIELSLEQDNYRQVLDVINKDGLSLEDVLEIYRGLAKDAQKLERQQHHTGDDGDDEDPTESDEYEGQSVVDKLRSEIAVNRIINFLRRLIQKMKSLNRNVVSGEDIRSLLKEDIDAAS